MKTMKKTLSLVLAIVMALALAMPAMAAVDAGTYTIKVTNSNDSVSINDKTFNAYKLFDVTYQNPTTNPNTVYGNDTAPHSYTLSTSSTFYTTAAAKTAIEEYFTLTAIEGDTSKVVVTPKLVADSSGKEPGAEGYVETTHFTATEAYALAEALKPYLPSTPNASAKASNEVATIDVSNKGDAGYYLVTGEAVTYKEGDTTGTATGESVTAAVALTTTDPKAEIIAKVDGVTVEKKIDEGTTAGALDDGDVKEDNHAVGDKVPYIIKSKVPNMTGYEKYFFIVTDTMGKGLTFNDDVVIKFVDSTGAVKKTLAKDTDYSVTSAGGNGADTSIEIVFKNFIQYKGTLVTAANKEELHASDAQIGTYIGTYEDCDIVITYSGTVNQYAVIGDLGNPNTAKIEFSNNPDVKDDGDPQNPDKPKNPEVTGETPESTTKTYVTGLKFFKYTGADKTALADAEFELTGSNLNQLVETNTNYFRAAKDGETATHYLLKDGTYTTTAPVTVDNEATTDIDERTIDSYQQTWTGTNPAPGFLIDTVKSWTRTADAQTGAVKYTVKTDEEGFITFTGLAAGDYVLEEINAPDGFNKLDKKIYLTVSCGNTEEGNLTTHTWTVTYKIGENGTAQTMTADAANLFSLDIENKSGPELPSTGGIGTKIFYTMGAVLVIGAGVVLVSRKRAGE